MHDRSNRPVRLQFSVRALFALVTCCAAGLSCYFWIAHKPARMGRAMAEEDWKRRDAKLLVPGGTLHPPYQYRRGPFVFEYFFDRKTGLVVQTPSKRVSDRFCEAYNARILELMKLEGDPPWSVTGKFPGDDEIIGLLNSPNVDRVDSFPYEVSPSIVICGPGRFCRWGHTSWSGDTIRIETSRGATLGFGNLDTPVYVGHLPEWPHIVFIRGAHQAVEIFHRDGRRLATASRLSRD